MNKNTPPPPQKKNRKIASKIFTIISLAPLGFAITFRHYEEMSYVEYEFHLTMFDKTSYTKDEHRALSLRYVYLQGNMRVNILNICDRTRRMSSAITCIPKHLLIELYIHCT